GFATSGNFKTLLPYFAPIAILAAGEVFIMINGEIDLSIGAVYLITPFLFYKLSVNVGLPLLPAVILALCGSALIGAINGFFIAVVGISSFVATFGMLFTLDGLTLAGLVGVLESVRTVTATPDPSGSNEILFQAIAAAVIGGTLLRGGSGTVVGALIGALFLGVLHDGLIIKGVSADYLDLYLGLA